MSTKSFSAVTLSIALCVGVGGLTQVSHGALIASDSFSTTTNGAGSTYSTAATSQQIYGQNPTAGLSGFAGSAWGNSNSQATTVGRVQTTGLTHSLMQGTALSGSAITGGGSDADRVVQRLLSSYSSSPTTAFSVLLSSSGSGANGQNIASVGLTGSLAQATTFPGTNGARVGVSGANLVLWVGSTSTTLLSSYTPNSTYFVTVEITDGGTAASDTVTAKAWASANTTFAAPTATVSIASQNITGSLGYLSMLVSDTRQGVMTADEFRLGNTLSDVVVPEPTSLALLGLGGLCLLKRRRRD